MKTKIFMTFTCVFFIFALTGCNTNQQGIDNQRNDDNYEQVRYPAGENARDVIEERDDRFPFQLFPRGEENNGRGLEAAPQPAAPPELETPEESEEVKDGGQKNEGEATSQIEQQVIELTNEERKKEGLSPLKVDPQLAEAAHAKSMDMVNNNYFAHNSPTYGSPFKMLRDFGVKYTAAAENIAAGQESAEEVVQAWMNSAGHRKNILNEEVTHIGIGYVEEGNHWTQLFIGK